MSNKFRKYPQGYSRSWIFSFQFQGHSRTFKFCTNPVYKNLWPTTVSLWQSQSNDQNVPLSFNCFESRTVLHYVAIAFQGLYLNFSCQISVLSPKKTDILSFARKYLTHKKDWGPTKNFQGPPAPRGPGQFPPPPSRRPCCSPCHLVNHCCERRKPKLTLSILSEPLLVQY